jgi:hypothetical protein
MAARLAHLSSKILSCVGGECRVATRWRLRHYGSVANGKIVEHWDTATKP